VADLAEVQRLIDRFEANLASYKSAHYKETQLRREFLDPLFRQLGWDVENAQGYPEAYKDVVHEDAIRIGLTIRAPDYCFRVGGTRKFFVEAKRPAVNLDRDTEGVYQLRRYAWSAGLPVSILTNFEFLTVYDCRFRPNQLDGPVKGRLLRVYFADYVRHWDELSTIFARDAAVSGGLDEYVKRLPLARGTATVDDAILVDIERWREGLGRNIASRNASLDQAALNFAVQATIDRTIFLRICEARGIEPYGQLESLLAVTGVYAELVRLFNGADAKYNSGLFHFAAEYGRHELADEITPGLSVDDGALKPMIQALYYPDSPYEFSVIPADILGHVYEQFLGKTILVAEDRRVIVEEKPEVKKAGGVYYTPTHIVEYIVATTLAPLLAGTTPTEASDLRLVDPACGSGSFLIGAYQYLVDWHRDFYIQDGAEKHRNVLYQAPTGEWVLTVSEKKRILTNNIYGVDVDAQAVEVTKLSLLLKVLEGESQEVLAKQLALFHERALPDLGSNIKCGNSLVGTDWYGTEDGARADRDLRARINAFDWATAFKEVFERTRGGFDAVVGNPPYVFGEYLDIVSKTYYRDRYAVAASGQFDLYWLFVERALALARSPGRFAMIVPDAILARDEAAPVRRVLLTAGLERVYHCGLVFAAMVSATVIAAAKGHDPETLMVDRRDGLSPVHERVCTRSRFASDRDARLLIHMSDDEASVLRRVESASDRMERFVTVSRGEELGKRNVLAAGPVPNPRWRRRRPL
jgi:hypothetical protein